MSPDLSSMVWGISRSRRARASLKFTCASLDPNISAFLVYTPCCCEPNVCVPPDSHVKALDFQGDGLEVGPLGVNEAARAGPSGRG